MKQLVDQIVAARACSTPILAITTPDQRALQDGLLDAINGTSPIFSWDRSRGIVAVNKYAHKHVREVALALGLKPAKDEEARMLSIATLEPQIAMRALEKLPKSYKDNEGKGPGGSIVFAHNMNRFFREPKAGETIQAIANLIPEFKSTQRTLIMLSHDFDLPGELRHDVIMLDDPLPTDEGYSTIIKTLYDESGFEKPTKDFEKKAARAVRGLAAGEAEQILAMSIAMHPQQSAIDLKAAWDLKMGAVGKVKGLSMTTDGPPLEILRGMDSVIDTLTKLAEGPMAPEVWLRVDEIEKSFAGLGTKGGPGDNTGVTSDFLAQFLTNMEDNGWTGFIFVGVRGSGKTILTRSIGAKYGAPTISMDTGAMKDSKLGESEANIRDAFRMIKAIGGKRVAVLATSNDLDVLPPEMLRRFKFGIYYFDVLTAPERAALWPVYLKEFNQPLDSKLPNDEGWTGAEIRNCCEIAYALGMNVREAAKKIIPIMQSNPASIQKMRTLANDNWMSAANPGPYAIPSTVDDVVEVSTKRKLTLNKSAN